MAYEKIISAVLPLIARSLGERDVQTKVSGGELKSMLKNKEAEMRDRAKQ